MTTRRTVLSALAAGLPFAALTWPASAQTALRISTASAENDWLNKALQRFKHGIETALPGQLAVSLHANASLFRQGTEVPALQRGNLEMSTMTTFEVEQQLPEYGVLSAGYVLRDYDHLKRVLSGPIGHEYIAAVAARMGIQIVAVTYLGTRQVNLAKAREVQGPADLAGVKLRMPPGPGWVALGRGLGVTPTPMGIPEVYLALKNGAIDGQENPLNITKVNNFQEVTQQIVMTSHLVQPVFLSLAKPFWDRLAAPQQEVIRREALAAAEYNDTNRITEEKEMAGFFEKAGLRVTAPDLARFRASVKQQYEAAGLAQRWAPGLAERIAETV